MVEKSKNWAIVIVGLLLIAVIASAGCVDEKAPEEGEETPTGEVTTPTTQTPTAPSIGESLGDIFGKSKGITSVKYDMVTTSPGEPTITQKIWLKGNNMRVEMTAEGETMITIMNGDKQELYMYYPEGNMAMKMDFSQAPESAIEETSSIEQYNPTVIGTETIDGKLCTVVEYVDPEGILRTEMKNIEFGDIPDSMFELPAGVEIMEMPGGMPPMPSVMIIKF
jgi:outer membrane lipoprotein-sorting protein